MRDPSQLRSTLRHRRVRFDVGDEIFLTSDKSTAYLQCRKSTAVFPPHPYRFHHYRSPTAMNGSFDTVTALRITPLSTATTELAPTRKDLSELPADTFSVSLLPESGTREYGPYDSINLALGRLCEIRLRQEFTPDLELALRWAAIRPDRECARTRCSFAESPALSESAAHHRETSTRCVSPKARLSTGAQPQPVRRISYPL